MEDIVVPVAMFGCVFGCLYVYWSTRHRERMAMIEKGIQLDWTTRTSKGEIWIKLAFLSMGVGVGLVVGALLNEFTVIEKGICYGSMVTICGGLGLFASHFVKLKKN